MTIENKRSGLPSARPLLSQSDVNEPRIPIAPQTPSWGHLCTVDRGRIYMKRWNIHETDLNCSKCDAHGWADGCWGGPCLETGSRPTALQSCFIPFAISLPCLRNRKRHTPASTQEHQNLRHLVPMSHCQGGIRSSRDQPVCCPLRCDGSGTRGASQRPARRWKVPWKQERESS